MEEYNLDMVSRKSNSKGAYKPILTYRSVESIESSAWARLSPHAVWILMEFYKKFNGYNRTNLSPTDREVKGKIASSTFSKSIWELVGYGFIDVKRFGRLERNKALYALSNRWKRLGEKPWKLDRIGNLLARVEKVKHINTPRELGENQKSDFRIRRREMICRLRRQVLGV